MFRIAKRMIGTVFFSLILVLSQFFLTSSFFLESAEPEENNANNTLTGNWNGLRNLLEKKGITVDVAYTAEMMSVLAGGLQRKAVLLDNKDIIFSFDFEKLVRWKGMSFYLYILGNSGACPSEYIGDLQGASNIDAPDTWKIYEAWCQQFFWQDKLSLKVGLYDLNSEFDVIVTAAYFVNSSFGIGPDFSQTGENGPSIFPTTSLGCRVRYQSGGGVYWQSAILDGVPGHPHRHRGTHIILNKEDGFLIATETGWQSQEENPLYKIALGTWFYTAKSNTWETTATNETDINPIKKRNQGLYILGEAKLFSELTDANQGLAAFLRWGKARPQINRLNWFCGAGFVYTGLLPKRDHDSCGLAIAYAHNGAPFMEYYQALPDFVALTRAETVLEFTYHAQLTDWLILKPTCQYIIHPGTDAHIPNALVFGLRSEIIF